MKGHPMTAWKLLLLILATPYLALRECWIAYRSCQDENANPERDRLDTEA